MSLEPIVDPVTSPRPVMWYYDSLGNIAPLSIAGFLDGSGLSVPPSAANPLPVTISGSGGGAVVSTGIITNPTSVLTRPSNILTYAQNNLVANNATAGSVTVPSVSAARVSAGSFMVRRIRLTTNVTTGWDVSTFTIRFWSTAPTYSNGDRGAYAVLTGAAGFLGAFVVTLAQFTDGAAGIGVPSIGTEMGVALASGLLVYWDLQYTGVAVLTPISSQTFTLTLEDYQN